MAAAATCSCTADIRKDLLQCAICQEQYSSPKTLNCQHCFCARCLKGWLQTRNKTTNKIKCAVCRKVTVLPQGGVDLLPESYVVKGLMSMLKKKMGDCNKEPGKSCKEDKVAAKPQKAPTKKKVAKAATQKTADRATSAAKAAVKAATTAKTQRGCCKGNVGRAGAKTPIDKNANMQRGGKKKPRPVSIGESSSGSESESDDSDSYSDSEDDSDDDSLSDSDESYSDSDDSDVPPTPTLKTHGAIKVGMQVYVFNRRGKPFEGTVKLLETCEMKRPLQPRTYAGVELLRENSSLTTDDMDDIMDSYLSFWLEDNDNPCAVVRADDCIPVSLFNEIMSN